MAFLKIFWSYDISKTKQSLKKVTLSDFRASQQFRVPAKTRLIFLEKLQHQYRGTMIWKLY